jgi:iron complex outermembrane receptor protein
MFDKNIKSTLSYSTQAGENEDGNTLNDISPTKMSFVTEFNLDNFQFITDIYYRGKHLEVGPAESTLASMISANINTRWFINEEFEVSMGVTNLLNKLYRTTADEDAPFANERRIKLNLSWHRF